MAVQDYDELYKLTSDLVRIPSVTGNAESVSDAADFIRQWLSERGISARRIEYEKEMPVVVAEVGKGKRQILLNGHFDVVPEGERKRWSGDPYSGKIEKSMIFGRGTADMKSGVALFMKLFAEIADRADYRLVFTAVPDEEVGGAKGALHLAERYKPDLALVSEPSRSELIGIGEKGLSWVKLTTSGKTAHASLPSLGENAIMRMTRDLERFSEISKVEVNVPREAKAALAVGVEEFGKDVGRITFNPGTISGGLKPNVVPDRCEAMIDMRLPPGISSGQVLGRVRKMLKDGKAEQEIAAEPNYTAPSNQYVRGFVEAARKRVPGARTIITNYATDGRYFRYNGVPTVSFGPGDNKRIHSYDESVSFEEMRDAYRVYADFLEGLGFR